MTDSKSKVWTIPVRQEIHLKVAFSEELTQEEALQAFRDNLATDVMDEDEVSEEVLDWAEPIDD